MDISKYNVDMSKIFNVSTTDTKNNDHLIEKLSDLVNKFNDNLNNKNEQLKIIKLMRQVHGIIIKNFFDMLKSQGNFNHEEFYILSLADTGYTVARNIIKQAEDILRGKSSNILDDVILNTDDDSVINDDIDYIKNNVNNKINDKLPTFVLFFESWCGACKSFKPTWNELVRVTDKKYINLIETNDQKTMEKYNIQAIPTLIYFGPNGKTLYEGSRGISQLADFINGKLNYEACKPLAA
jgi:thiol-disulfide isomerase/thioredoxin